MLLDNASTSKGNLSLSCGEAAENISKEVIELIKMCPKSTMMFSKFIPTYHNHFGKQCRVADYGCTKLIEMFEAMSSVVQVRNEKQFRRVQTVQTSFSRFLRFWAKAKLARSR
jgi:meiosis arrest female protein 1